MNDAKIKEIINKVNETLKEYPDITFKLSAKSILHGFDLNINAIDTTKIKDIEDRNFRVSERLGFTQNIIGMEFQKIILSKDKETKKIENYKITEFKTNYYKYPIIAVNIATNRSYKFSSSVVKKALGGDEKINRIANLKKMLE